MALLGLNRPPRWDVDAEFDNSVANTGWKAIDIPVDSAGQPAQYVLLSFKQEVPGTPWHLLLLMDPAGVLTPGADEVDYCTVLHGVAHNPIVLNVAGINRVHVRASAGTSKDIHILPIDNPSAGNPGPLAYPLQIAANTVSVLAASDGTDSVTVPDCANGEPAKFVLVSWDAVDQHIYCFPGSQSLAFNAILSGRAHNPMLLNVTGHPSVKVRILSGADARVRITPLENF